jgi:hypothetical protein
MATHQEVITAAFQELGLIDPIETLSAEMLSYGLQKYNRLLDSWNAMREAVYVTLFANHTLTPSLNPHTIGPSAATFNVTQRPVSVENANIVIAAVQYPVTMRDAEWYANLGIRTVEAIPTDLYYATGWPNGSLYLYPIPDQAYTLELWTRVLLTQVVAADVTNTFTLPPGYWDAIVRTLAEDIAPAYNVAVPTLLSQKAAEARETVFANNRVVPRVMSWDAGMPSAGGRSYSNGYNWLTGQGGGR